jgi:hypothetical protein
LKAAHVRQADGDPLAAQFAGTIVGALMNNFLDLPMAGAGSTI